MAARRSDVETVEARSAARASLMVVGVGTLVSLVGGLLVGLVIGDVPLGLGRTATVGMIVTAVVGVLVAMRRGR